MKKLIALLGVAFGLSTGVAHATAIIAGETTVEVTADLTGLGLGGSPFGTATANAGVFTFPITGGTDDQGDLRILHDGSGVTLFTLDVVDTTEVTVGNFIIDTSESTVFGDVIGGPTNLDLFTFGTASGGIGLDITSTLAGALTGTFGAPNLTGVQFGIANTTPITAPIPLPASMVLMVAGLAALPLVRSMRKSKTA